MDYERMIGAAIVAANAAPIEALGEQRDRYDLAKRVADEFGAAVVSVLPIINGRYHARAGRPPIVPIHDRDNGYAVGYLWEGVVTRVLVFLGTHSRTARRWIMRRAWDDVNRRRGND